MKVVCICSPLDLENYEMSVEQLKKYQTYAVACGMAPVTPALMFEEYYNDVRPERKELADNMAGELLKHCSDIWVCGDTITEEKQRMIDQARSYELPVLFVPDSFVDGNIKIRQEDAPFSQEDCIPDSNRMGYENRILVLDSNVLIKNKQTADYSLWKAYNGFGCTYGARGQAVYATNLLTGENLRWERSDFLGIVEPRRLLEWMWDKPVRNELALETVRLAEQEVSNTKPTESDLDYPYLIGYYPGENGWERTLLIPAAENIASYIVSHGHMKDIQITTPLDQPFITTFGMYINKCTDQAFLQQKLLPALIPMQQGETEPKPVREFEEQMDCETECDEESEEDCEI